MLVNLSAYQMVSTSWDSLNVPTFHVIKCGLLPGTQPTGFGSPGEARNLRTISHYISPALHSDGRPNVPGTRDLTDIVSSDLSSFHSLVISPRQTIGCALILWRERLHQMSQIRLALHIASEPSA